MSFTFQNPFAYFNNPANSNPVGLGNLYVGLPDTDPVTPVNQVPVFAVQPDGSELAIPQPVRMTAGGILTYNGTPIQLKLNAALYSVKVTSSAGAQLLYTARVKTPTDENLRDDLANGTAIIDGLPSSAIGSISEIIASKYVQYAGADAEGLTDSSSFFQGVGDSQGIINLNGGTYLIQQQVSFSDPVSIVGPGRLIIDWGSIGSGAPCFIFNGAGSSVQSFGEEIQVDPLAIPSIFTEDIDQVVFLFNCDDPAVKSLSFGKGHHNCIRSIKSNARISAWGITGIGLLDGLTNNTAIHTLINISDGQGGSISNWRGEGFCHAVLFDLSTNRVSVSDGEGVNCANHALYISSGDDCHVDSINAYGINTDIKCRGHGNTVSHSNVYGGSLSLTNRVADAGGGYSTWGLKIDNCHVDCTRENAIPVEIGARTGFDTFPARDCGISNTTVTMSANTSDGVRMIFYGLEDCYISNTSFKPVGAAVVGDGIKMQPTDGATSSRNIRGKVTASNSTGCSAQAYQLVGDGMKLIASSGVSAGGTGGNSGCVLLRGDNASITAGCDLRVTTGGIPVVRQTSGNNLIVANNILRRGDAATSFIVTTATTSIVTPNIELNA